MKAIVCTKYGSPEVLRLQEVEKPEPKDNEVRIKVMAASIGPSDCAFRKGDPFIVKLIYGLRKPRHAIMGTELAGLIDAVGKDVRGFRVGDRIFGISVTSGAHAEYKCLPENKPLVHMPTSLAFEEAAAICDGAPTALTFLRDKAKVRPGQKVLVNGASGAVGLAAVQLAKHLGAEVTGVCSGANAELVRSQGADRVIDYTKEDFVSNGLTYDVIFDAVGKRSFAACRSSLAPRGVFLSTVPSLSIVLNMLATSLFGGRKAIFATAGLMQTKENLLYLKELCETGKLRAVIDRRYSLEQVPDAHRYVDTGRKKGNVVITF
ncbi:NAD(P)-dependent alcohol dehydrogenase [Paenibacillus sp. LHD-117]|uniref:NAD(P)-dependent alcohol dehydrogenase n=1 Tax=Paenibacillus sp. LHD-117 TaxID=3071412 RepID=UPI0027E0B61E|nr:NAD(P)-dependent alcohol dehydrogenase [Paenibacillus sp. LHD-117]MDQ6419357.1 NAD(P)-dependent alcohol dehydrogenase [Paenibacillus sp. LHD-117]